MLLFFFSFNFPNMNFLPWWLLLKLASSYYMLLFFVFLPLSFDLDFHLLHSIQMWRLRNNLCVRFFSLSTWCVHFLSLSHDLPSLLIFIRLFKLSEFVFNRTWKRQTEAKNEKRSNVIYYKATSQNIFFGIIACIYYTYSKRINSPIRYVNK